VKTQDLAELAARNLRESVLRNSLTTLGIAVGVASLVAMLSLGIGLQQLAGKRLGASGLFDTVIVTSRQDFLTSEERRSGVRATQSRALDEDARKQIERLTNVVEVYPDMRFVSELRYQDRPYIGLVAALPASAGDTEALEEMRGRFFSGRTAEEALVQTEFATELNSQPGSLIGQELVLRYAERTSLPPAENAAESGLSPASGFSVVRREQRLKIVGILDQEPYGGMRAISRARVFIPIGLAEELNIMQPGDVRGLARSQAGKTYPTLVVRVSRPNQVQGVQDAIEKIGLRTFSVLNATRSLRRFFAILDLFLGIFGSLALAVASLGIVNTLVMAILERRREIGIMKAVGASDSDVKRLFFAEAGAMGVLGGMLGIALGWAIGRAINFGTNIYLRRQQLPPENIWAIPWWLVLGALIFAALVSLVSGLYPAARAARLDPVQALRYE